MTGLPPFIISGGPITFGIERLLLRTTGIIYFGSDRLITFNERQTTFRKKRQTGMFWFQSGYVAHFISVFLSQRHLLSFKSLTAPDSCAKRFKFLARSITTISSIICLFCANKHVRICKRASEREWPPKRASARASANDRQSALAGSKAIEELSLTPFAH